MGGWAVLREGWMSLLFLLLSVPMNVVSADGLRADGLRSAAPAVSQARVVSVQNLRATDAFEPRAEIVQAMLDRAVTRLTGQPGVAAAWGSLVATQDVVGIKVYAAPGAMAGTRPAVVAAVVQGLLAARVPATNIVIWDRRRADLESAGYHRLAEKWGVRLAGAVEAGYDEKVYYESPLLGRLLSGDLEFNSPVEQLGRKSHVSKLVSRDLTKIIVVAPLLNNYEAGVAGNLYSLALGSVDNIRRFAGNSGALAQAVPEIYAQAALSDHVVLNITDALICQFEGGEHVRLHNATALNEIRASRDPVALDVLSARDIAEQRQRAGYDTTQTNYAGLFQNAALLELGVSDLKQIQVEKVY